MFGQTKFWHPFHERLQIVLSCGKHCITVHIWCVSRIRSRRRPSRLKINVRRNVYASWVVTHSCQSDGLSRSRQLFHPAAPKGEIVSWDAGLRFETIPALNLWYSVNVSLYSMISQKNLWNLFGEYMRDKLQSRSISRCKRCLQKTACSRSSSCRCTATSIGGRTKNKM